MARLALSLSTVGRSTGPWATTFSRTKPKDSTCTPSVRCPACTRAAEAGRNGSHARVDATRFRCTLLEGPPNPAAFLTQACAASALTMAR